MRRAFLCLLTLLLSSCAKERPASIACNYVDHALLVPNDFRDIVPSSMMATRALTARTSESVPRQSVSLPIDTVLRSAMQRGVARSLAPSEAAPRIAAADTNVLLMSGGGPWGAYGASFMESWQREAPSAYPEFALVTGVSTGALIAPFVVIDDLPGAVEAYSIAEETVLVERRSFTALLGKLAILDKTPLSERIDAMFAPGAPDGRFSKLVTRLSAPDAPALLLGVVSLDDSQFYAINVNTMVGDSSFSEEALYDCFKASLLASAAVPLAFDPEFIDRNAYIDGGVRLSAFFLRLEEAMLASGGAGMNVFVLKNGSLPDAPEDTMPDMEGSKISSFDVALVSVDTLVDQVSFNSIQHLLERDDLAASQIFVAAANPREADDDCEALTGGGNDLGQAFPPDFMACLIERGKKHWDDGFDEAFVFKRPN
ncbi:MAG: patatin-like phospholipase family protein [Sphingomonadales bacterium]